ncbi:MAG: hypothetical protein ACJZ59_07315 [Candidatus Thalassarchaeaceae archaeon]
MVGVVDELRPNLENDCNGTNLNLATVHASDNMWFGPFWMLMLVEPFPEDELHRTLVEGAVVRSSGLSEPWLLATVVRNPQVD